MSLSLDSLVTDLMFQSSAAIDQKALIDGLGGQESLAGKQLLDVDRLDPRAEMELSPSMPFRRRGERRLLIIDDQTITPRADPQTEPWIKNDLRPAREALIKTCQALPLRLARLFALGSWGDAVIVSRSLRDLRAIALLAWALDPHVDQDGKRRGTPLSQKEFEAKIAAYDKRLEELDDAQILANLTGVTYELRGDVHVVDVLEADGTWDQRRSLELEAKLAALDRFSMIPGAPSQPKPSDRPTRSIRPGSEAGAKPAAKPAAVPGPRVRRCPPPRSTARSSSSSPPSGSISTSPPRSASATGIRSSAARTT
jgi:hypothetical protein